MARLYDAHTGEPIGAGIHADQGGAVLHGELIGSKTLPLRGGSRRSLAITAAGIRAAAIAIPEPLAGLLSEGHKRGLVAMRLPARRNKTLMIPQDLLASSFWVGLIPIPDQIDLAMYGKLPSG